MLEKFILHTKHHPEIKYVAELHGDLYCIWFLGDENKSKRQEGHWRSHEVYKFLNDGDWVIDQEEYTDDIIDNSEGDR